MEKKDTSWNKVADWYDTLVESDSSYQKTLIVPNVVRLAGTVAGKNVLDLACGQGVFSEALAKAGAQVTGVDLAPELVKLAQSRVKAAKFFTGSAEKLPDTLRSASFDEALCVLALQNIRDIDAALRETARVLKSGGTFIVVLNHPAFRIPKRSSWGTDPVVDFGEAHSTAKPSPKITTGQARKGEVMYRRLDGYMSESHSDIVMNPGKEGSATTITFHRPLQYYFKLFDKHGFAVTRLEEWVSNKTSEPGPKKAMEDRARKEFPLFLALVLKKF